MEPGHFLVIQSGAVSMAESLGEVRIAVAISEKTANIFPTYGNSVCEMDRNEPVLSKVLSKLISE